MTFAHPQAHKLIPAATVLAAALILSGCTSAKTSNDPSKDAGAPVTGGTLVYASGDAEPSCLDPHVGGNYPQALVASQYLETLYTKDADGKIIPWLAQDSTVTEDGLTRIVKIRDGIKFTDGTALDAEAVKVNFEHLLNPETASSTGYLALGKISSMTAVDATTLEIKLSSPDNSLLESFSMPWVAIESPTALKRSKAENCESPVGTGPFKVESWKKQDAVNLVRNADYALPVPEAGHAGPAYLDGITWRFIPEAATRFAALQAGQVQVIDNAQPDAIAAASKGASIKHLDAPRPGAANRIELNSSKAPFNDEKVREAFVHSVNVDAGIESLFFGTASRSYSPLSSVEPLAFSEKSLFSYDPAKAGELLDAAGWKDRDSAGYRIKDGNRLTLAFPVSTSQSIPAEQSLFEQMQATAKESGFEIKIKLLDISSWYGDLAKNDYNLVSAPYTKVGPSVLSILFHSKSTIPAPSGYFANLSQVKDPTLDELLDSAGTTKDPAQRKELYTEAQKMVLEGYYLLPLYDQQNHFLYSEKLKDVGTTTAVASPTFFDSWLAN
ncbi:ABC transporter substrate-binding protein [Arthrobacter psychrochitiniphilus]|uniref:Peptide ABC transporter substrate-binding protein n=1 Tax=Arthrobacter psychrochitiniphilus TaxID=291045 RepID=A0A2V3DNU6_9MICC|nr:ABC transporter substrate-binding protein [Arthrobacter psychrochitiniphilus]NYG17506.1 peptide/nickel transport system substrate-binding protein [Arthrobacter psychrochitiniphilus]PXA64620.1 peptide ABC transporter substrate-binding protein [Arthrobacter psychrochitiniphilus]